MKYLILTLLFAPSIIFAQVGIGTSNPQETLHVNGSVRVTNTNKSPASRIMGSDANGTLNEVTIGQNLVLTGGTLDAAGANQYYIATKVLTTTSSGHQFHNMDLQLDGTNNSMAVIRLTGATNSFKITGITGGTDGRHILLLNVMPEHMSIMDEHTGSVATNRIRTFGTGSFEKTANEGTVELVYDGVLQRWIILNFRS